MIKKEKFRIWKKKEHFKTKTEGLILKDFHVLDLRPIWQFQIGKYIADFAFPEYKICIEIDGEIHQIEELYEERDKKKDIYYKKHGWKVIRIKSYNDDKYKVLMFDIKKIMGTIKSKDLEHLNEIRDLIDFL